MKKNLYKVLSVLLALALAAAFYLLLPKINKIYQVHEFYEFKEYNSYTTQNGKYTVSLRNCSEEGLAGAMRLNVYLVDNGNGDIEYIGKKRLDYYDDFTPYVEFTELDNKIIVSFYSKYSTDKLEVSVR